MKLFRLAAIIAGAALVLNLAGCATSATSQAMTVQPGAVATVNPKLKGAVALGDISGGKETSPLWKSEVDNAGFKKALQDSLAHSGYLASDPSKAAYKVSAELKQLDQPFLGFTLDVTSQVAYQVTGPAGSKPYAIKATGSAGVSDSLVGVDRLRIANERSVLENIKAFLNELSKYAD